MAAFGEVTVSELKSELDSGKEIYLLDVREEDELEISKLEGAVNIPMGVVPLRFSEVPSEAEIVVICRSGNRSEKVSGFLVRKGYENVRNLVGGMNAWATEIDTSMSTY